MSCRQTAITSHVALVTIIAIVCFLASLSGAQLPLSIEVDRLVARAERHILSENHTGAIAIFDRIIELYGDHQVEVPADFWINDAQLADRFGLYGRAVDSVNKYLEMAGQQGDYYWPAIELLNDAEDRLRAELEEQAEARRRAEEEEAGRQAAAAQQQAENTAWERIQTSFDAEAFEAYAREFPGSAYRDIALNIALVLRAPMRDENGWTNLHYAAAFDQPMVVHHLVGQGSNVNSELERDGEALSGGVRRVLSRLGRTFSSWTRDGETPLHVAAAVGARNAAAELIERGADVDRVTKFDWRPLHYAAWADAGDVIELLLANGADMDARTDEVDEPGKTPLAIAVQFGRLAAVRALRARSAR